jgi:hypothetical protein
MYAKISEEFLNICDTPIEAVYRPAASSLSTADGVKASLPE